jgi:hypothetical protein
MSMVGYTKMERDYLRNQVERQISLLVMVLVSATLTGVSNTGVGSDALDAITTGGNNTAIGRNSLGSNTTGSTNTAVGSGSLFSVVGEKEILLLVVNLVLI